MGATNPNFGRDCERLHDAKSGLLELGSLGGLAGNRINCLFHLQPQTQPRTKPHGSLTRLTLSYGCADRSAFAIETAKAKPTRGMIGWS